MKNNDTSIKAIAERLVELRTFNGYTTKELAGMLEIEEAVYLRYESGEDEVPINTVYRIAARLETEPSYILNGLMPEETEAFMVTAGNGLSVKRYEGYSFSSLAAGFRDKEMNPMLVTISPTDAPELVKHDGQEFNYVLEGELRVIIGSKDYYLRAGDSIYFNPQLPHAQLAMNNKPAKFLTIITKL